MVKTSNYLTKGFFIEFQKYNTKLECPFVIYGDFECLTVNSNDGIKGTYQEHKPCRYMLNVVNRIDKTSQPYLYRGENYTGVKIVWINLLNN